MARIQVNNLYKVFGPDPSRAFPLLRQGYSKSDILEKTGCVVGIDDATFDVH